MSIYEDNHIVVLFFDFLLLCYRSQLSLLLCFIIGFSCDYISCVIILLLVQCFTDEVDDP